MTVKQEFVLRHNGVKLTFGVPLEDVFPEDEIHPYLEYLFALTYQSITNSDYTIEEILTLMQGSMSYRLDLKKRMEHCFKLGLNCLPGALFWILRHFLGLLPLPLLPHYTNGETFKWVKLSEHCWRYIIGSKKGLKFEKLNKIIINEFSRLPLANLLMMTAFLAFVRELIVYPLGEPRINKYAAMALAQYFCSSLFIRPYIPGYSKNRDKNYLPLLLYLILKWPQLETLLNIHKQGQTPKSRTFTKVYFSCEQAKVLKEQSTQTIETIEERISSSGTSKSKNFFLNNTNFQTEIFDAGKSESKVGSWLEKINNTKLCCCTYGSHYRKYIPSNYADSTRKNESENEFPVDPKTNQYNKINLESIPEAIEMGNSTEEDLTSSIYYGWISPELSTKILKTPTVSPISFTDSGEYIYDEYNQTIYEDAVSNIEPLEKITENPQQTPLRESKAENIMEKVTKIGWSYSVPIDAKETSTNLKPGPTWTIPKKNYQLCFDIENNDSVDEKIEICEDATKFSSLKNDVMEFSNKKLRTKRSLLKLKKAASKIDFLHVFSRKREIKISSSAEQVTSKIKYKKMNSSNKSNLF